jgi:hypothetical protein
LQRFLYILIGIGTLAGLYGAALRFRVEQGNRRVELALDYQDAKALAQIGHQPLPEMLSRFKGSARCVRVARFILRTHRS